ncbi:MAG: hypothetical protein ACHREM_07930 [Polyangiales bacterium]
MTSTKIGLAVAVVFLSAVAIGNATAASGGTASSVTTSSAVTPAEQRTQAAAHVARIEQASRRVRKMSDEAVRRGQQDMMKAMCLSDKVNQLQALSSSAAARQKQHESAVSVGDGDLANHHFAALGTLRRRAEQLDTEANQCVGEVGIFTGDTKLTSTVDPNIVDPDPGNTGGGGTTGPGGTTTPTIPPPEGSPKK